MTNTDQITEWLDQLALEEQELAELTKDFSHIRAELAMRRKRASILRDELRRLGAVEPELPTPTTEEKQ